MTDQNEQDGSLLASALRLLARGVPKSELSSRLGDVVKRTVPRLEVEALLEAGGRLVEVETMRPPTWARLLDIGAKQLQAGTSIPAALTEAAEVTELRREAIRLLREGGADDVGRGESGSGAYAYAEALVIQQQLLEAAATARRSPGSLHFRVDAEDAGRWTEVMLWSGGGPVDRWIRSWAKQVQRIEASQHRSAVAAPQVSLTVRDLLALIETVSSPAARRVLSSELEPLDRQFADTTEGGERQASNAHWRPLGWWHHRRRPA